MSQTISQILDEYTGFSKAFWASYSVNFTTLVFLLKKDFKQMMMPHYLHFICDGQQLDESIAKIYDEKKNISKLSRLQEYCTISPQFTEGAFHPKILLFTAETKLLFVVSSANATPSGILSNQDLIGTFYYDEDHQENRNEVAALFQYMRSYEGWGLEAREDFKIVEESFGFLQEDLPTDNVLVIPNQDNLFSQITKGLPAAKMHHINIFSPFFDAGYAAISEFYDRFNVPVNIFSPQKEFQTDRTVNLPSNIKFYQSGTEINKIFHAKFYEFNYGDESIVYWGSANCSYSGLLSPDRNYEFLIRCQMSKEEIHSLWGSLGDKSESSVEYGHEDDQKDDLEDKPVVQIKGISVTEDGFVIQLNEPFMEDAVLKGIISNGTVVDFTILAVKGDVVHAACEENGLVILYIAKDQKRISNLIYINNPFALKNRVAGRQASSDFDPQNIKSSKAVTQAFGYFNLKQPKQKSGSSGSAISRKGFWRLSQFKSRSRLSRIINLESFIKQRVIKLKEKNDRENIEDDDRRSAPTPPKSMIHVVTRETNALLKNIGLIVKEKKVPEIEISKWLQGIDILNYYVLNYFDEISELPKDNTEMTKLLLNISRISTWIIHNLLDDSEDHSERVELIRSIQDISLGLMIYNLLLAQKFSRGMRTKDNAAEYILSIEKALFLRHVTIEKFPELKIVSEHSQLTYEDVLGKLFHLTVAKKAIEVLNRGKISSLVGSDKVLAFSSKVDVLLFIRDVGSNMDLETILGEEKQFTHTAPLTKKIITA